MTTVQALGIVIAIPVAIGILQLLTYINNRWG